MKRQLIILMSYFLLPSCNNHIENIKFDTNGDTLEVVNNYPSKRIKEIVYYKNNRPADNIGFYENGDTIKRLTVVYTKEDSSLFAFIPLRNAKSYDIYIGIDSGENSETKLAVLHNLTDKLNHLNSSTTFKLPLEFVYDRELKGVFKSKLDSAGKTTYIYQPFEIRIQ